MVYPQLPNIPEKDGQRTDRPPRSVVPHGRHPCDRPKQGGT